MRDLTPEGACRVPDSFGERSTLLTNPPWLTAPGSPVGVVVPVRDDVTGNQSAELGEYAFGEGVGPVLVSGYVEELQHAPIVGRRQRRHLRKIRRMTYRSNEPRATRLSRQ